jgi:signal transduction histidine kinase
MIKYLHVVDQHGHIVSSNLPESHKAEVKNLSRAAERKVCPIEGGTKRHGKIQTEDGTIYLCSYAESLTNRNFKRYLEACQFFFAPVLKASRSFRKEEQRHFRRLRHNLVTHNTNILQELYKLVPQDSLVKGGRKQAAMIRDLIERKPDAFASGFLRILKSATLMKSEFDVHDMIASNAPYLEFNAHSIHKVVVLVLSPFWLDLVQKGIHIEVGECHDKTTIDYKSLSVALCHLFDNATKYMAPNSTLKISFAVESGSLMLTLAMLSIRIPPEELQHICDENFSGELSKKLGLAGSGIGMFVVKRLVEMNKGKLSVEPDADTKHRETVKGIPYEVNRFTIQLRRAI